MRIFLEQLNARERHDAAGSTSHRVHGNRQYEPRYETGANCDPSGPGIPISQDDGDERAHCNRSDDENARVHEVETKK